MAKSIPITIGTVHFPSRASASDAVRCLMSRYGFGDRLNKADKEFCMALFEHHSQYLEKLGSGIRGIEVRRDEQGNKYFHLLRLDDSAEDISWVHCIYPKKEKRVVYEALRSVVKYQIQDFKNRHVKEGTVCPFYGVALTASNSHVDHFDPTFESLVAEFFRSCGRTLSYADLIEQEGNDYRGTLKDSTLLEAWRSFHSENANLRLISQTANLSEAKRNMS